MKTTLLTRVVIGDPDADTGFHVDVTFDDFGGGHVWLARNGDDGFEFEVEELGSVVALLQEAVRMRSRLNLLSGPPHT